MSRYQQRIIINNPEKTVPDDIVQQFFMAIKTANVDTIRNFALKYKNKYNIIEKAGKENTSDAGKSPFHIVLELDDKVADDDTKLRILHFLANMGAPMDIPDASDVWPIHLAASMQSKEIVDFFIKNKVNLNRKDSSNNTPLHYAIIGKEITCPKPVSIGSLIPSTKRDKPKLNTILEKANTDLIKIIGQKDTINNHLIHIINTIMKIPDMYAEDKVARNLEANIITIFSEVAGSPEYAGGLTIQQNKLDQLIDNTVTFINNNLLKGLTNPLNIAPNNGGWGPTIPTGNPPPNDSRPPNNMERIMADDRRTQMRDISNEYLTMRNSITMLRTNILDQSIRNTIPALIDTIRNQYINKLIFCPDCREVADFGENVGLTKMLYLLIWNYALDYPTNFANRIMKTYGIMNEPFHHEVMDYGRLGKNRSGYLFESDITFLIGDATFNTNRTNFDTAFSRALAYIDTLPQSGYNECIRQNLKNHFLNSDERDALYIENSILSNRMGNIFKRAEFSNFSTEFNRLRQYYKDDTLTWFTMFERLLDDIARSLNGLRASQPRYDIFRNAAGNIIIPRTPLPNSIDPSGNRQTHTLYEMFRIMYLLETYFQRGDFEATAYPQIFGVPISNWNDYVDWLGNQPVYGPGLQNISRTYPEFIFLYKMLIKYAQITIRRIIIDCIRNIINRILGEDPASNPDIRSVHELLLNPFDDAYVYALLLPSDPDSREFDISNNDPFADIKSHKWDNTNSLVRWFGSYINGIDPDFINRVTDIMNTNFNIFDYRNIHQIRRLIETDANANIDTVKNIVNDKEFRNHIRRYFGTYRPDLNNPSWPNVDSINILPRFNTIASTIRFVDVFARNLERLINNEISQIHFLTETYGYIFAIVRQLIGNLTENLSLIRNILADIIVHINNENYYFIPQIFLPAVVKQMIISVGILINIRNTLQRLAERYADFIPYIDMTRQENITIINLGNEFVDYITRQMETIYGNIMDIAKYHNTVIEFLNYHSAYQLIRLGENKRRLFDMNLIPLDDIPNIFTQRADFESLLRVLRAYRIPKTVYNGTREDQRRIRNDIFAITDNVAPGNRYTLAPYRDIIVYNRSGTLSNSPTPGENLQINITATNNRAIGIDPDYILHDVPTGIAGEWLNIDTVNPDATTYHDAFIGYIKSNYSLDWLGGMPPSIRSLANRYLRMRKQRIVEITLQHVINNKDKNADDPDSTKNLYNSIQNLGIDEPYTNLNDVKVYIVIAKLVDETLNRLLNYTIRQSVNNWIYQYISRSPQYSSLTNIGKNMVNILVQQDYLKMALADIDKEAVDKLLASGSSYLGIRLNQIEPFPNNLSYSTKPTPNSLIHYLYNINYFGQGDLTAYKRCYNIDPNIAAALITPDTINQKNSDGYTALHMAVLIHHPGLVELLLSRGANPTSFKDNRNQSPQDIIMDHMIKHINFSDGKTVLDSINNFVVPFNDILLLALRDERYANNIIKNITMAIPLQLIMYNHMIKLYLENYQYNFTIEMKNSIKQLLKKYELWDGVLALQSVYPIDLFIINDTSRISNITTKTNAESQLVTAKNIANQKKIEQINAKLELINNQLNGLEKEKQQTQDSQQIIFIEEIIARLLFSKQNLEANLSDLQTTNVPASDYGAVASYQIMLNSIVNRPISRGTSLTDFYKISFDRFGKNRELELAIWNNYLEKNLTDAPSMILPLAQNIIRHLIYYRMISPFSAEIKTELNTMVAFFDTVRKYIETKASFPLNIAEDENPLLNQEYKQIVYIINLIITPAMRNILLNHIYQGFKEMDLGRTLITNENIVFNEILNIKYGGHTFDTFMYDRLPTLAFKYFTSIYRSSSDPDMQITNANDLFLPLIQLIKANKLLVVDDNSAIIQNIRNYLIPYMINTYQNVITKLRLAIYGYERYLLNTYQLVKILQLLI